MDLFSLAVIAAGLLLYSLISGRLEGTIVTAPLVFIIFGFIAGSSGLQVVQINLEHSAIHFIAEFTLILVLFTDAARIDLSLLRRDHNLPLRMLVFGLPLTIVLGLMVAALLFLVELESADNEIFIAADDDSAFNNYRDIEDRLLDFGLPEERRPHVVEQQEDRVEGRPERDQQEKQKMYRKPLRLGSVCERQAKDF